MLPVNFLRATLIALDLPRHLADTYPTPDRGRGASKRNRRRHIVRHALAQPLRPPAWPFRAG
ncbi:MAG: hypothetical protein WCE38_05245 [Burkholderiales bacterium]